MKNGEQLAALLKRLDVERHAKGELVMFPGTDMRWYALTVAIAGLLNREREILEIKLLLHSAEIRVEGDIVGAVKRLVAKMWANDPSSGTPGLTHETNPQRKPALHVERG